MAITTEKLKSKREQVEEQIKGLEAEIKKLKEMEEADRKARAAAVKAVRVFTIKPVTDNWDRVFDDTLKWYYLHCEVTNAEELKEAGWASDNIRGGGMRYLYNSGTKMLVMSGGGGTIYLPNGQWMRWGEQSPSQEELIAEAVRVYKEIGAFIDANPDGGDVTSIVTSYKWYNW